MTIKLSDGTLVNLDHLAAVSVVRKGQLTADHASAGIRKTALKVLGLDKLQAAGFLVGKPDVFHETPTKELALKAVQEDPEHRVIAQTSGYMQVASGANPELLSRYYDLVAKTWREVKDSHYFLLPSRFDEPLYYELHVACPACTLVHDHIVIPVAPDTYKRLCEYLNAVPA